MLPDHDDRGGIERIGDPVEISAGDETVVFMIGRHLLADEAALLFRHFVQIELVAEGSGERDDAAGRERIRAAGLVVRAVRNMAPMVEHG